MKTLSLKIIVALMTLQITTTHAGEPVTVVGTYTLSQVDQPEEREAEIQESDTPVWPWVLGGLILMGIGVGALCLSTFACGGGPEKGTL